MNPSRNMPWVKITNSIFRLALGHWLSDWMSKSNRLTDDPLVPANYIQQIEDAVLADPRRA